MQTSLNFWRQRIGLERISRQKIRFIYWKPRRLARKNQNKFFFLAHTCMEPIATATTTTTEDPAKRLGDKVAKEFEKKELYEREGVPVPTTESNVENLLKLIQSMANDGNGNPVNPDGKIKKNKSGQYRFHKAKNFQTTYSDGSVRSGLQGISFHATPHSTYKGPVCANCGRMHDLKKCARCRQVYYCDRDCQTIHWSVHKTGCQTKSGI